MQQTHCKKVYYLTYSMADLAFALKKTNFVITFQYKLFLYFILADQVV